MTIQYKRINYIMLFIFIFQLCNFTRASATSRYYDPIEPLTTPISSGVVWYVDGVNGSDSNSGKDETTAFKTIGKAVDPYGSLKAGDTVLIMAGIYREKVVIKKSGTSSAPITIGPYGNGEVIVDISTPVTGWSLYKGDVFKAPCDFNVRALVVDDEPYFPEWNSPEDITSEGKWYYDPINKMLYLWVKGGASPSVRDVVVVKDDEYQEAMLIYAASYVNLFGLTIRGAGGHGINIFGDFAVVEKCNIKFNGKAGINIYKYGSVLSTDVKVLKNNIYHNVIRNWPRGRYKWGGWAMGVVSNGTPNIYFSGNISHKNGGEGIGAYGGDGGTIIEDNISYDNWSVNIYLDNQPNAIIRRNVVYSHEPDPGDLYNNLDPDPNDGRNLRRLRPEGIMTADENYNLSPPANFRNAKIYNNLIVNCRRGISHYGQALGSGLIDCLFANNTIIVPNSQGTGEDYIGISIPENGGNNSNTIYENNIIYAFHKSTHLLWGPLAITTGITLRNNLWYSAGNLTPFYWTSMHLNYPDWKTYSQQGASSKYVEPKFVTLSSDYDTGDFHLQQESPAIDSGQDISSVFSNDFELDERATGNSWDIGADEYNKGPKPIPLIQTIIIQ